jgi:hypothetical protein
LKSRIHLRDSASSTQLAEHQPPRFTASLLPNF